jgi:hypothetical protein
VVVSAPRGDYFVRVRARNANGIGAASLEAMIGVHPEPARPSAPFVTVSGRSVTVRWFAPFSNSPILYYELLVGSARGVANLGVFFVGTLTQITVDGLPPGTYYVRLRATSAFGTGEPSTDSVFIVR